ELASGLRDGLGVARLDDIGEFQFGLVQLRPRRLHLVEILPELRLRMGVVREIRRARSGWKIGFDEFGVDLRRELKQLVDAIDRALPVAGPFAESRDAVVGLLLALHEIL